VDLLKKSPGADVKPLYSPTDSLEQKVRTVAQRIYGAADVTFSEEASSKLKCFSDWGFANLPVCIAKTQYSFTDDPKRMGAPTGWTLHLRDASLSAGAGFVVVIAGNMMLMPGLPSSPRALSVNVDADGVISGV